MNNILLVGLPGVGKTTIIKKVIEANPSMSFCGFYTEELREHGKRMGFLIKTIDGKEAILAHRSIRSLFKVGSYGVSIKDIEEVALPAIGSGDKKSLIIIDEIGKMECFSRLFKAEAWKALDGPQVVLGTIANINSGYYSKVKSRGDVELHEVTYQNRDSLADELALRIR